MATALSTKRLMHELSQMTKSPHGSHVRLVSCEKMDLWSIDIVGAEGTLYAGEVFTLRFRFPADYPLESPEVVFVGKSMPVHPHVYSNGHICLSILYQQWSPALTVEAVCLSILSMLSSCKQKERPKRDEIYVRRTRQSSPKKTIWRFDGE
ncbi:ubiquitin-conjugating enzyme E2 W [Coemansia sp. RSA 2399]|nr:ubiquitin-conjugating enzyme E2 W [Coemansia sp. RSA 2399]KAJ1895622.1 ubiquitin-conjugating enzyme E2 W [Coemansia sp. IMI 209127]